MKSALKELPITMQSPQGVARSTDWGKMNVGYADVYSAIDLAPLLKGLPDDRCQCPHWGYVIKGQINATYADHEETYNAGDAYYLAPGHTIAVQDGTEYVEFSPSDELAKSQEVIARNLQAMSQ